MGKLEIGNRRLDAQCAAFVRLLPEDVRAETLFAFDYPVHLQAAWDEHVSRRGRLSALSLSAMSCDDDDEEDTSSGHSSLPKQKNSIAEDEANQTPSPVEHGAEHSLEKGEELSIEETIEESKEQNQEHQQLQSQKGQQSPLPEEEKPQADENPAKRGLSGSDDSDAGNGKPDMQRMKEEHGAVARPKTTRSNRWGAAHKSSGKEESQSSSTVVAFGMANKLAADQQQITSRRGVSNNLRGTHDPVLGFGGEVKSLESIRKDIFRSVDSLKLPKG
jgi:hypothetical protein